MIRQQPNLGKEASSSLIELGGAISETATPEEISVLLRGTLYQESYVRTSCLQALQVRFSILLLFSDHDLSGL